MISPKLPRIWYGADYNPDQWPEEVWQEDVRLMRLAGVNIATLPVFSWVALQPYEDTYTFEWLDRILDLLHANGVSACLATSTAAQPAWMSAKYPDVLPVDYEGRKRKHGIRQNYCPNSPNFRRLSRALVQKMAERYARHPGLVIWHVSNEYGPMCYCEECAKAFRTWLQARYGSLDELNRRWYTAFWSHGYTDWSQIETPTSTGDTSTPSHVLDYKRFQSDSVLDCYRNEVQVLRAVTPGVPITTNLMGAYKDLDYFKWAAEMDVVSWDSYPGLQTPAWDTAMRHDLMRGLKGGKPIMLMEQTPDQVNWQGINPLKPAGVMRLQSWQAVAHGADAVMFFQWRRGRGGYEKFHGAFVAHTGDEYTRTFRECAALGAELAATGDAIIGSTVPARVGILFDWECWWAVEYGSGPTRELRYVQQAERWYCVLHGMNVAVEFAHPQGDLSKFDVVIVPSLYMVKPGTAEALEAVAERGGAVIGSLWTGIVDGTDLAFLTGYPGPLRRLFGVWNEEIDPMEPGAEQRVCFAAPAPAGACIGTQTCSVAVERLHPEGSEVLASYTEGWHAGEPAVTRNAYGQGEAVYVGTDLDDEARRMVLNPILSARGIAAPLDVPAGVEVMQRVKGDRTFTFVLNNKSAAVSVSLPRAYTDLLTGAALSGDVDLPAYGVLALE
ncbi:MAG TPA: beta-galactosidase [Armatimonadota bacterium]